MAIPNWSAADLLTAMQNLLPRGRAWRRDAGAVITQMLAAFMPTFQRVIASGANLVVDGFPSTTVQLIPEWEASLGLPDSCTPLGATIGQQQAAIVEKFTRTGGQSKAYYIGVAARLGYTITITEGAPGTYVWTIHSSAVAPGSVFRVGQNRAGDLLATPGSNAYLQCVFNAIKPAHTVLAFSYP
jgi:uncharacterized protein YmfQ (DUF2313 family)